MLHDFVIVVIIIVYDRQLGQAWVGFRPFCYQFKPDMNLSHAVDHLDFSFLNLNRISVTRLITHAWLGRFSVQIGLELTYADLVRVKYTGGARFILMPVSACNRMLCCPQQQHILCLPGSPRLISQSTQTRSFHFIGFLAWTDVHPIWTSQLCQLRLAWDCDSKLNRKP